MLKLLILPVLLASKSWSMLPISTTYSLETISQGQIIMISQANVIIKNVRLEAREETIPPKGVPENPNRDIGFASVFITLENTQATNVTVLIKKIEILNASNGKLQNFSHPAQEIHLKPLEYSQLAFHLHNKTGYIGHDRVKVIVTYQIGDRVKVIESASVEIQGH